jgi:hypothetical protein
MCMQKEQTSFFSFALTHHSVRLLCHVTKTNKSQIAYGVRTVNRPTLAELWMNICSYSCPPNASTLSANLLAFLREIAIRIVQALVLYPTVYEYCGIKSILSLARVTIDGDWIGNRIYWALKHTTRDYTLEITITHRLVFSVTVITALVGSGFQRRTFHFFWVPELSSATNSELTLCL